MIVCDLLGDISKTAGRTRVVSQVSEARLPNESYYCSICAAGSEAARELLSGTTYRRRAFVSEIYRAGGVTQVGVRSSTRVIVIRHNPTYEVPSSRS